VGHSAQTFDFHPLAVDDALQENLSPKVDDWEIIFTLCCRAIGLSWTRLVDSLELDVFVGKNHRHHHDQLSCR
jgi:hypothetical protein